MKPPGAGRLGGRARENAAKAPATQTAKAPVCRSARQSSGLAFSRSRISLPVLKNGTIFSVTGTLSPVRGLRPVRASALLGRERAETAQLDAFAARQRVGDLAENGVDDVLDVALIEMRIARRHALHEFGLDQRTPPRYGNAIPRRKTLIPVRQLPNRDQSVNRRARVAVTQRPRQRRQAEPVRRRGRQAGQLESAPAGIRLAVAHRQVLGDALFASPASRSPRVRRRSRRRASAAGPGGR